MNKKILVGMIFSIFVVVTLVSAFTISKSDSQKIILLENCNSIFDWRIDGWESFNGKCISEKNGVMIYDFDKSKKKVSLEFSTVGGGKIYVNDKLINKKIISGEFYGKFKGDLTIRCERIPFNFGYCEVDNIEVKTK